MSCVLFDCLLGFISRNLSSWMTAYIWCVWVKQSLILQARLQQYMNCELPDVQAGFRKGRGTRDQIANIHWIIEKARVPEKHLFLLYWQCKAFECVDHNKLWKILKEMGIPDHLICLLCSNVKCYLILFIVADWNCKHKKDYCYEQIL